ncbi:MAG: hypothetical protein P8P74_17645 [Crocinitomicaceae bacterium]|nr:hypothetical protein [Crocinitomicaceae bacterium]
MDCWRNNFSRLRTLLIACFILSIYGCGSTIENKEGADTVLQENVQEEDSLIENTSDDSLSLVYQINREQVSKLNASSAIIASKINELQNSESQLSPEELLDERVVFRDNRGQIISIPLRSLIDTFYYE